MASESKRMAQKRATAANWTSDNPVLLEGEIGYELDTGKFKIGDGLTAWSSIDYFIKGTADGDKGDISVSGNVWTIDIPLTLGDDAITPWFGQVPVANHLMTIGYNARHATPTNGTGLAGLEIRLPITNNTLAGPSYGQIVSVDVQGPAALGSIVGISSSIFCNSSSATDPASTLVGVEGVVDMGGTWENSIGGYFAAFSGGSGSSSTTSSIIGVYAGAGAIHNGNTGESWAADCELFSSAGSPGTLGVGASVRARLRLNSGATLTDYRGVSISDWTQNVGCSVTNAYGLYIDNSFDSIGTSSRYAIRSLSVSDSLFAGPVKGPLNAYDATTWNGSTKFATEDAVRDKFESLGTSSVTGTGVAARFAMWTAASVLTNVPMTYDSGTDTFVIFKTTASDAFRFDFKPSNTGAGLFKLGDESGTGWPYIRIDEGTNRMDLEAQTARLGDWQNIGQGTSLEITDANKKFDFNTGSASGGIFRMISIDTFQYRRTLTGAGTTGAQTINRPLGSVNVAAGQQTLVVTNSIADTSSLIFLTVMSDDTTAHSAKVSAQTNGSFTIKLNAAATAETKVAFRVTN